MANVRYFGGGAVDLGTKNINANGTYDASSDGLDGYSQVTVNVPEKTLGTKSIVSNGTYNASADNVDGYSQVTVNVPSNVHIENRPPSSADGAEGDAWVYYDDVTDSIIETYIFGGYNGGANIKGYIDGVLVINATGDSPYNTTYDIHTGVISKYGHEIKVVITDPSTNTSPVTITWYIDDVPLFSVNVSSNGTNNSSGYSYYNERSTNISLDYNIVKSIYYKQSGVWLTNTDTIII